ncbi:pentapeptide repeat-containing protein [Ramlibacter sp.]|uniref:pentapeptide repeat-containing protein n=1 Tax=Ramlibacter sp. TaxID=1917967 RepID=UPI003D12DC7F
MAVRDRVFPLQGSAFSCFLLATLLSGCGGGERSAAPSASSPSATPLAVARRDAGSEELLLPLVRSGERFYADVRLVLLADGRFEVARSSPAAASATRAPDATLEPAVPLESLPTHAGPVQLHVRRHHGNGQVWRAMSLRLAGGRWQETIQRQPSAVLQAHDFRAGTGVAATEHHFVALPSSPGSVHEFPLKLQARTYRFCAEANGARADRFELLDAGGRVLVATGEAQPCVAYEAADRLYKARVTYGGGGATRTVFLRRRDREVEVAATPAQAMPRLAALRSTPQRAPNVSLPVIASQDPEYVAVLATRRDVFTGDVIGRGFVTLKGVAEQGCLTIADATLDPATAKPSTLVVDGWSQSTTTQAAPLRASVLFDARNFWQRTAAAPTVLGPAYGTPCSMPYWGGATGPLSQFKSLVQANPDAGAGAGILSGVDFTLTAGGAPFGIAGGLGGDTWTAQSLYPMPAPPHFDTLSPDQAAAAALSFRAALRYWPAGPAGDWMPGTGQVALSSARDCSGPQLVVDNYALPALLPGPLGTFAGSMRLGLLTSALVFPQVNHAGTPLVIGSTGCVDLQAAAPFPVQSLAVRVETVDMVFSHASCERCDLAYTDFTGYDMSGAQFAGADFSGSTLTRANLARADLRNARFQSSALDQSNLDSANLCGAALNPLPSRTLTDLSNAYLRNANLAHANLDGAVFNEASFHSSSSPPCQPADCNTYSLPQCATAYRASITGTNFGAALLARTDFSNANGNANFGSAVLAGATLTGDLTNAVFTDSFLMGTTFPNATLTGALFSNATYASDQQGCWQFMVPARSTTFPGYVVPSQPVKGDGPLQCVAPSSAAPQWASLASLASAAAATAPAGSPVALTSAALANPAARPWSCVQFFFDPTPNPVSPLLPPASGPPVNGQCSLFAPSRSLCGGVDRGVLGATGNHGFANTCW